MPSPPPHAAPMLWPTLRADDARGLIRFLVDVVGFEEVVVYGDGDTVDHAELAWPLGGGVMLGSVREDQAKVTVPGGTSVYVAADDIDGLHAKVVAAGATVVAGPHDTDYGSRDFALVDPEGNTWSFGTYRGHRG